MKTIYWRLLGLFELEALLGVPRKSLIILRNTSYIATELAVDFAFEVVRNSIAILPFIAFLGIVNTVEPRYSDMPRELWN